MNHGTTTGYRYHRCRCDECRTAHAAECSRWRQEQRRRGVPADVPHGYESTYNNYGCRCDECVEAKSYYNQRRYQQKKAVT